MKRILDPVDRVSEILFGVIMVMTFTSTFSVAEAAALEVRTMVFSALTCNIAWGLVDAMMYLINTLTERMRERPSVDSAFRPRLQPSDWTAALAVFLLVFLSTFPLVIPFLIISDATAAVHVSDAIGIAMLFACGFRLGQYAYWRPWRMGAGMAMIGVVLVVITIALGG